MDVQALLEQFHRDGYMTIPDALSPEQVERLQAGVERAFATLDPEAELYGMQRIWRPKMFERGPEFEELIDNARVIDLVEAILGRDCHLIAKSARRTGPGEGLAN